MHLLMIHFLLATWPASWTPMTDVLSRTQPLDVGYLEMYNLQFADAHRTFAEWEKSHPEDPLALTSDGAAYLFSEFDRLGVLQSQLFVDDGKFKRRKRPDADPAVEAAFNQDLNKSDRLADAVLEKDPRNRDALLAKVLNEGMRGDYAALIQKRDLASLVYMKNAGQIAERLLAVDPHCYDAYLAVGIENYMLGLSAAPVRWVLRLYGAETNKQDGIDKLELTAEKGHYLLPFARLLLAVAAMRDRDNSEARDLLENLAEAFPNNDLYRKELARIQ